MKFIILFITAILLSGCIGGTISDQVGDEYITIHYDKTCINGVVYIVYKYYNGVGITAYIQPNGNITLCDSKK